jgi:RHS repeat-associated protein
VNHPTTNRTLRQILLSTLALWPSWAAAQTSVQGHTPPGMAMGAPEGAYAAESFERINLFNGHLNLSFPLHQVEGRGGLGYTIALTVEQSWTIRNLGGPMTSGTEYPWYNLRSYNDLEPGYGPGVMVGRKSSYGKLCGQNGHTQTSLTRLTFTAGDGTEYEFRDAQPGLEGRPVAIQCSTALPNRGRLWVTADGSFASFRSDGAISDIGNTTPSDSTESGTVSSTFRPSGDMVLRDGTRYRIDQGLVTSMQDRNGNRLTFEYEPVAFPAKPRITAVVDSLLRVVTFEYTEKDDYISYTGAEGAERTIQVHRAPMGHVLAPFQTIRTYQQLFPGLGGAPQVAAFNPLVTAEVFLPNNRSFQFNYTSYGEVANVYPASGGRIAYAYDKGLPDAATGGLYSGFTPSGLSEQGIYRRLVERKVFSAGLKNITLYSRPETWAGPGSVDYVEVDERDADWVSLRRTRHYFHGSARDSRFVDSIAYPAWRTGREYRTEVYEGAARGGVLLRRIDQNFEQGGPIPWWTGSPEASPAMNPRINDVVTRLPSSAGADRVSRVFQSFDRFNDPIQTDEFDYGAGGPGPLLRRTVRTYLESQLGFDYADDFAIHLRGLPKSEAVFDPADLGNPKARTTYEYDDYSSAPNHAPLVPRGSVTQHDATHDVNHRPRGNVTGTHRWLDEQPPVTISSFAQFDVLGNLVKTVSPRGNATAFDYADHYGLTDGTLTDDQAPPPLVGANGIRKTWAYPTSVTNPLGHRSRAQYDYFIGRPVDEEDPNLVVSSTRYFNPLDRKTRFARATNHIDVRTNVEWFYDDALHTVVTKSDLHNYNDSRLRTKRHYAPMNGLDQTLVYENPYDDDVFISVQRFVDPLSRPSVVSNPARPENDGLLWTRTYYDALDRVVETIEPYAGGLPASAGASTSRVYDANLVTVTDPAGKKRRSELDALGRVVRLVEDPGGLGYATSYTYDVLGNLTHVAQFGQQRSFVYDSLGRLRRSTQPESGTETYSYDRDGNLLETIDARGVATGHTYDSLGRVTRTTYSDGTPTVTMVYDQPSEPGSSSIGRLSSTSTSVSSTSQVYDALGQVVKSVQTTAGRSFAFTYRYNRAGSLVEMVYPSGRKMLTPTDETNRPEALYEASNPTHWLAAVYEYHPHGAVQLMKLGNGLYQATGFTKRLQPSFIGLGPAPTHLDTLLLSYRYGNSDAGGPTPNNNGSVEQLITQIKGFDPTWVYYTYDELDRLKTASEKFGWDQSDSWSQTYAYDRFGNRAVAPGSYRPSPQTPQGVGAYNVAKNQLWTAQYDVAGNMTVDPQGRTSSYDAENRQISFTGPAGTTNYSYDGAGRRVKVATPTQTNLYVYDAQGRLALELGTVTGAAAAGIAYLTPDALGTPRVATNAAAQVVARHDYLPFGEEIPNTFAYRPNIPGYGVDDGIRQKFTGQERDGESGLDFFQARYLSSALGRFASVDPARSSAETTAPQTWNRYTYAANNPMRYVDPYGLWTWAKSAGGGLDDAELMKRSVDPSLTATMRRTYLTAIDFRVRFRAALAQAQAAAASSGDTSAQQAVAAWGSENDGNNVWVGVANTGNAGGSVTVNHGAVVATFNNNRNGPQLAVTLGHEGRHAADAVAWIANGRPPGGASDLLMTDVEFRGRVVGGAMAQALGLKNYGVRGGGPDYQVWNRSWKAADVATLRARGASNTVRDFYTFKPGQRMSTFYPR